MLQSWPLLALRLVAVREKGLNSIVLASYQTCFFLSGLAIQIRNCTLFAELVHYLGSSSLPKGRRQGQHLVHLATFALNEVIKTLLVFEVILQASPAFQILNICAF